MERTRIAVRPLRTACRHKRGNGNTFTYQHFLAISKLPKRKTKVLGLFWTDVKSYSEVLERPTYIDILGKSLGHVAVTTDPNSEPLRYVLTPYKCA